MASSVGHQRRGDSKLLLFLSLLLAMAPVFDGRVVAVWSDMESIPGGAAPASPKGQPSSLPCCGGLNRTLKFIEAITEATSIAHTGGIRFAVDGESAWSTVRSSTTLPSRPLLQQVMDIVVGQPRCLALLRPGASCMAIG